MIFPKRTNEGGGLRMAAMELDLARERMANRVAQSWKMRRCALESHSPPRLSLLVPVSFFLLSLSLSLFFVSMCLSTCAHAIMLYRATEQYPCAPVDVYLTRRDAADRSVWVCVNRLEKYGSSASRGIEL